VNNVIGDMNSRKRASFPVPAVTQDPSADVRGPTAFCCCRMRPVCLWLPSAG